MKSNYILPINCERDKKQLLFDLKDYIKFISFEDLQEILNNSISYYKYEISRNYTVDLQISFKNNCYVKIFNTGDQEWYEYGAHITNTIKTYMKGNN